MQLSTLLASTDVIVPGSFTMVERELEAGTVAVIPTPDLNFARAMASSISRIARSHRRNRLSCRNSETRKGQLVNRNNDVKRGI
jgi:hypothetical protein